MFRKTITAAVLAVAATIVDVAPVLASVVPGADLPAPGVLGLVAIGIIGAIALARNWK